MLINFTLPLKYVEIWGINKNDYCFEQPVSFKVNIIDIDNTESYAP